MSDAVEFATVTPEEWEKIPPPVPPKPKDRFEQLLVSVGEGNIVKVNAKEEKDIKGMRIAIARKARNLGFIAEFRNLGTALCKFGNYMGGICIILRAAQRAKAERKCVLQHDSSSRFGSVGCSTQIPYSPAELYRFRPCNSQIYTFLPQVGRLGMPGKKPPDNAC